MTTEPPVLIKSISQKDNHTFTIEWSDGICNDYRLNLLQKNCPCAKCFDVSTNQQRIGTPPVDEDVRAKRITNVGRYALRVEFTSGCSTGIYSYAMLRKLSNTQTQVKQQ